MPDPRSRYLGRAGEAYAAEHFTDAMAYGRRYQARLFASYCSRDKVVLDFGCGDGSLLASLPARRRIGVEINPACAARIETANARLQPPIELHPDLASVADEVAQVAVLNHSLEHVEQPFAVLRAIRRVLAPGGRLALVTPFDDWRAPRHRSFTTEDPDGHLYTWSPLDLGNLVSAAGFEVESARLSTFAWSPRIFWVRRLLGETPFRLAGWLLARIRQRREVVCLAFRPAEETSLE